MRSASVVKVRGGGSSSVGHALASRLQEYPWIWLRCAGRDDGNARPSQPARAEQPEDQYANRDEYPDRVRKNGAKIVRRPKSRALPRPACSFRQGEIVHDVDEDSCANEQIKQQIDDAGQVPSQFTQLGCPGRGPGLQTPVQASTDESEQKRPEKRMDVDPRCHTPANSGMAECPENPDEQHDHAQGHLQGDSPVPPVRGDPMGSQAYGDGSHDAAKALESLTDTDGHAARQNLNR